LHSVNTINLKSHTALSTVKHFYNGFANPL